jgi:hypothetical protein
MAEELRKIDKKLIQRNATRWSSILAMIRSLHKITPEQLEKIQESLPTATLKQREMQKNFCLSKTERTMIAELIQVLEVFEWVTNQLQTNEVSISRVLPCVQLIRDTLSANLDDEKINPHTKQLRRDLLASLASRFDKMLETDVFLVSTYLDPKFGPEFFSVTKLEQVRARVKVLLTTVTGVNRLFPSTQATQAPSDPGLIESTSTPKFTFFRREAPTAAINNIDQQITEYETRYQNSDLSNHTLLFWKTYSPLLPTLSQLAKKYLGVPASAAEVERMFSICGHIINIKRRRMCVLLFVMLVILKLNDLSLDRIVIKK